MKKAFFYNKKGQMLIFFGLAFTFLFLLFAMVVNISFIVTAKMNLQNSVDLAAYAGAAQQARYMTALGNWNYEMRRNYKAFTFDNNIVLTAEYVGNSKEYINMEKQILPIACCSARSDIERPTVLCNSKGVSDFSKTLAASLSSLSFLANGGQEALPILASAIATAGKIADLQAQYGQYFKNYISDPNDSKRIYNYNRRLIAWNLQDYRSLQARIRGVHFGKIKDFATTSSKQRLGDPYFIKSNADEIEIFENAPMSVAAKILNGYTGNTQASTTGRTILLSTESDVLKNPIHNAAFYTFTKNLFTMFKQGADTSKTKYKLFHIQPKSSAVPAKDQLAQGCGGKCPEFTGPYINLHSYDATLGFNYIGFKKEPKTSSYVITTGQENGKAKTTYFPIGVAKDERILTYYALAAVAELDNIPFNVYYGKNNSDGKSKAVPLVAVAAARPFGSRIGPSINSTCENFTSTNSNCTELGWDPLYPPDSVIEQNSFAPPNFSILDTDDSKKAGIRLAIEKQEITQESPLDGKYDFTKHKIYTETEKSKARWRDFFIPTKTTPPAIAEQDGLPYHTGTQKFFEDETPPVHPMGCKNSIIAWPREGKTNNTIRVQENQGSKSNTNYENYLDSLYGKAIVKIDDDNRADYSIYLFKYPNLDSSRWDIETLTKDPANKKEQGQRMEKSFARVMAVNEFEIKRYIPPIDKAMAQLSGANSTNPPFDWFTSSGGNIFAGVQSRSGWGAKGNNIELFGDNNGILTKEKEQGAEEMQESYTAWRTGIRGYRVKLVTLKELINNNDIYNPLEPNVVLEAFDESGKIGLGTINLDLNKIDY